MSTLVGVGVQATATHTKVPSNNKKVHLARIGVLYLPLLNVIDGIAVYSTLASLILPTYA